MIELNFEKEGRPFYPHLTIARVKEFCNEEQLNNFIKLNIQKNLQELDINEFILYESILKSTGPIYKPIECFRF
jgi:RNA 2',3'-cyclic 3'-phosphodiesterase